MGIGGGALPQKNQFRLALQYGSYLAFWPTYVIFTILFRAWSKILSPISNQVLHSTLKTWWEKLPKKMLSGCVLLKVYFLERISKPYSQYTVCISVYISLFQIRKDSYIAYDKLF